MNVKAVLIISLLISPLEALASSYLEEMRALGYVSGEGLACNAKRYPYYERLARSYLITKAKTDEEQAEGMYEYNKAKAKAFISKRGDGYLDCADISRRFNRQEIFKSKLHKNGTIKLPDGKIIRPRQNYDVSLVYNSNENERQKLNEYYDKALLLKKKRAKKEGIYQKIKKYEQNRAKSAQINY